MCGVYSLKIDHSDALRDCQIIEIEELSRQSHWQASEFAPEGLSGEDYKLTPSCAVTLKNLQTIFQTKVKMPDATESLSRMIKKLSHSGRTTLRQLPSRSRASLEDSYFVIAPQFDEIDTAQMRHTWLPGLERNMTKQINRLYQRSLRNDEAALETLRSLLKSAGMDRRETILIADGDLISFNFQNIFPDKRILRSFTSDSMKLVHWPRKHAAPGSPWPADDSYCGWASEIPTRARTNGIVFGRLAEVGGGRTNT